MVVILKFLGFYGLLTNYTSCVTFIQIWTSWVSILWLNDAFKKSRINLHHAESFDINNRKAKELQNYVVLILFGIAFLFGYIYLFI